MVMHSIVNDLLNKSGRAITHKVGKMLSKKTGLLMSTFREFINLTLVD